MSWQDLESRAARSGIELRWDVAECASLHLDGMILVHVTLKRMHDRWQVRANADAYLRRMIEHALDELTARNSDSACKDVLPMGPAKLDGEHAAAVAIEIRAAEIAAEYGDGDRDLVCGVWDEWNGWDAHEWNESPVNARHREAFRRASAGWLARQIAFHDSDSAGEGEG